MKFWLEFLIALGGWFLLSALCSFFVGAFLDNNDLTDENLARYEAARDERWARDQLRGERNVVPFKR